MPCRTPVPRRVFHLQLLKGYGESPSSVISDGHGGVFVAPVRTCQQAGSPVATPTPFLLASSVGRQTQGSHRKPIFHRVLSHEWRDFWSWNVIGGALASWSRMKSGRWYLEQQKKSHACISHCRGIRLWRRFPLLHSSCCSQLTCLQKSSGQCVVNKSLFKVK